MQGGSLPPFLLGFGRTGCVPVRLRLLGSGSDKLDKGQRHSRKPGTAEEHDCWVREPQCAADDGNNDRSDVVDGEADSHAWRDVGRIGDFLEKRPNCYRAIEQQVINDVHTPCHQR